MSHPTCASSVASKDPIMEALPTPTSTTTIPNPNDGTITTNGVMVSPAVWKQLQNMLAMYPTPPTSTPITADLLPPAPTSGTSALGELSNLEEDEDSLPDTNIDHGVPDTNIDCGEDKIPNDRVQATNPSSERDATPDLPPLITDLKSYDFTVGEPMDAPPITRFMTMDSLVRFCQMWAKTHGVIDLESTRQREPKKGRKTASTKIDCPFELMGSIPTSQKITNKFWTLKVREGKHNHDPSPGASSHAAHRRLLPEQVLEVGRLFKSNVKPAQILLQLRTSDDQTLATNKTVSNALQKNRKAALDGKTPVKALMCVLKESNWEWEVKVNASGAILNLFFAHPGSIHLARINHHVALLDSTYKTNRYKLPLLHDEENYLWAVNQLKRFIWKPERIPKVFITDRESALRNALEQVFPNAQANLSTSRPLEAVHESLEARHLRKVTGAVLSYIEKNIIPVKELFVVAWACQYPHLRNLNNSRVESGHAYLKTFVTNSTGDLLSVFQALALAVDAQILAVHESIGKDTIKTLVDVPKSCIPLLGEISTFAIKELLKQFKRLKRTMFQNLDNGGGDTLCSSYSRNIGMQEYHHARRFSSAMESQRQQSSKTQKGGHQTSNKCWQQAQPSGTPQVSRSLKTNSKKKNQPRRERPKVQDHHKIQESQEVEDVDVKDIPDLKRTEEDTDEEESSDYEPKEDLSSAYEPKEDLLNGIFTDLSDDEDLDGNKNEDRDEENNEETAANEKPSNNEDQSTTKLPKEGGSIEEFSNNVQDTYISQLPLHLQPYIEGIFNPKGDGNCGFHCVAKALGYNDDGWGREQEVTRIVEGLQVKTKKSKITLSKWLDKMAHGQVLANTYTRPVIFLSLIACNSFIPSRMGPQESPDTKPIYLVHVDGNHWVLATVQEIDGVMPIPPLILAAKSSSKSARAWVAFTKKGVALYKQGDEKKAP
ncbi:hypothetical protein PSHT_16256 [Puccinia striiformis]|uniref:MULE transposase domain-containing protein n=1 Tax=Puccinia striiformis TaxID=27350 RepID=A0A2S4UAZ5_9BASI|nr:hypothetical protein PSHT_16256 [Puccinia striiformis]